MAKSNTSLIKKQSVAITDASFPKYGEMRIGFHAVDAPSYHTQGITLMFDEDVELHTVGPACFTDRSLVADYGSSVVVKAGDLTELYLSNADSTLVISDKYHLTYISFNMYGNTISQRSNREICLDDFRYMSRLTHVDLSGRGVYGDIAGLSHSRRMRYLDLHDSRACGHVSSIARLRAIEYLDLFKSYVRGDYDSLPMDVAFPYTFPLQLS